MSNILSALNRLACSDLTHDEWIRVGMALKAEGFDESVWDEWSSRDAARYHAGECVRRWNSFRGSDSPVTGATIIKMSQDRGWTPFAGADGIMDWNDVIEYDGNGSQPDPVATRKPTEDLILYLQTLFEPEDHVGYVTNDAWQNEDGKWVPSKGVFDRTAGELIASLHRYPEDLGATVGDWKPEAGAWIRFNALDGEGVRNENVISFKYALVESDAMPVDEQIAMYRKEELPIAALVSSAGKSVHAIVHVDAADAQEYRKRVTFLYDFLAARGLKVDTQNRNPSRLSRMPGVTRNGLMQKLLGVNIGRRSWVDWMDFVEGATDELPGLSSLADFAADPPPLPEELIQGVLRRGHKMLISGSSKAGKSFLLMELCAAIAEGKPWLGFSCRKGRVLYVNLEIDPASCVNRFIKIYDALGYDRKHIDDIIIWNLRGHAVPLDQLVPKLIRRVRDQHLDAIIIDPIYKVITGDENSASDMAAFCNQFDRICNETGCSTIYCHHHSKGVQGAKRAMDRASGSGVFARDPDAQLDMIELELSDEVRNTLAETGATAWRLESSLREFENIKPVDFWFEYPVHRLERSDTLREMPTQGSPEAGRMKNSRHKSAEAAAEEFRNAYQMENMDGKGVSVKDMAGHLGLAERTIRERVNKMNGEFILDDGMILTPDLT
jgi:RecA-family ATPase